LSTKVQLLEGRGFNFKYTWNGAHYLERNHGKAEGIREYTIYAEGDQELELELNY
jgi:hypothetical protein